VKLVSSLSWSFVGAAIALGTVLGACGDDETSNPQGPASDPGEELSGGDTTVWDETREAFARAARNLDSEGRERFALGDHLFNRSWVTAPASAEGNDGLGPLYSATNCSACHFKDGRGAPPVEGDDFKGLLLRLSIPGADSDGGPLGDPVYGGQLNHLGILGVPPEARPVVSYEEVTGSYDDGETYSLRRPTYTLEDPAYGALPDDLMIGPRIAPVIVGLGLLEALPEDTLLGLADPDDADGDGISGRPNYVVDVVTGERVIGRFGWKANMPNVKQQNAGAFHGDLGITTSLFPTEGCTPTQLDCVAAPNGGSPELNDSKLETITFYTRTTAVPARRNVDDATVLGGRDLFREAGCGSCHAYKLETGTSPGHPELEKQIIWPYTDLLLHDMGEELADGRPDFEASGSEWRTPPLWGIGLVESVNKHTFMLHDGRARGFAEAILWHGGEAEPAREFFRKLSKTDRDALISFLESL
jgi:CxxC motif-containing protein (DUF1111 family)